MQAMTYKLIGLFRRSVSAATEGLKIFSAMLLVFCVLTITGPLSFAYSTIDPLF